MTVKAVGGVGVVVYVEREVTYADVENALHEAGFLSDYLIAVSRVSDTTEISVNVHLPVAAIRIAVEAGGPRAYMDAVQAMRSLADALEAVDRDV